MKKTRLLLTWTLLAGLWGGGSRVGAQTIRTNPVASCPQQRYIAQSSYLSGSVLKTDYEDVAMDGSGNSYIVTSDNNNLLIISKLTPTGTIAWSRPALPSGCKSYFGHYGEFGGGLTIEGGYLYAQAFCDSNAAGDISHIPNIAGPVTSGAGCVILKIDLATGNTVKAYGITTLDMENYYYEPTNWSVKNGQVSYAVSTDVMDLPVTDGSSLAPSVDGDGLFVGKLDAAGNTIYASYLPSRYVNYNYYTPYAHADINGSFYYNYSNRSGSVDSVTLEKRSPSGAIAYSKNLWPNGVMRALYYDPGSAGTYALCLNGISGNSYSLVKIDSTGNIVYTTSFSLQDNGSYPNVSYPEISTVKNGHVYITYFSGSFTAFYYPRVASINAATGAVEWVSALTQNYDYGGNGKSDCQVDAAGNVWFFGGSTRDNSSLYNLNQWDNFIVGFNNSGDVIYSSLLGGSMADGNFGSNFFVRPLNNRLYLYGGSSSSPDFPVTDNSSLNTGKLTLTALDLTPDLSAWASDTLSPSLTTVCKMGTPQQLMGVKAVLSQGSNVPPIYRNGYPGTQDGGNFSYQWQQSADSLTWTNIAGATGQNYLPMGTAVTMYYRRQTLAGPGCSTPLHTSTVAKIAVNGLNAPMVAPTVAGNNVTCAGAPVTLGFTITGGTAPYTTTWNNTSATLSSMVTTGAAPTAVATPVTSSIYTAKITDNNGCVQYGQIPVTAYSAGANLTTAICAGDSVVLGNIPATGGVSGIAYAWSPSAGLKCPTCPQTKAGVAPGVYTLTLTVPKTDGGTCTALMHDTVIAVSAPLATAPDGFGGPDLVLCSPANSSVDVFSPIGRSSTPGSGFNYTWTPGNYGDFYNQGNSSGYNSTIHLGSLLPTPNPFTYYLTATTTSGCTFIDTVKMAVLRADAGLNGCGPRMVGNNTDPIPGITGKTYSWTRLDNGAGAAAFQSGADLTSRTTYVTAGSINTRFVLTVTAAGQSCSDTVLVTSDCGCSNARIDVLDNVGCPKYIGAVIPVRMKAYVPGYVNNNLVFEWTPAAGLDRYDSSVVTLTDGVSRTYTVAIKDKNTGIQLCTVAKTVNGPGWSFPTFSAPDITTCPPVGAATKVVPIGQTPVAGYTYAWTGDGLNDNTLSNPNLTINSSFLMQPFPVKVTDVTSGCITMDTVVVRVIPMIVNAGPDLVTCASATATLAGDVDSLNGYRYAWTPNSGWIGGTDSTYLHAKIAVATNAQYVLHATNLLTGCVATDTMQVLAPAPSSVTVTKSQSSVCKGTGMYLTAPSFGDATYTWTSSNPAEAMPAAAVGLDSITVTPTLNNTIYSVAIDYGGSCAPASGSTSVAIVDLGYTPLAHNSYCPGSGPVTIGPSANPTTGTAPYFYQWNITAAGSSNWLSTRTTNVSPSVSTVYKLTIVDNNGCSITVDEPVNVVADSKPMAGFSRSVCKGSQVSIGDASNTNVTWSAIAPATTAMLDNSNAAAPVFTASAAGTFKFTVQHSTGCVNRDTITLVVTDLAALMPSGVSICSGPGAYASIGVTPVAGLTYQWSPVAGLDNPTASKTIVRTTADQVYTLTATDLGGCQASAVVPVTVSSTLAPVVAVPDVSLCIGGTSAQFMTTVNGADVSNSSNYSASWTPAINLTSATQIRPSVIPADNGQYQYTLNIVDMLTGCPATTTANAIVNICGDNTPLSVKLLSFNAQPQDRTSLLTWTTASDQQTLQFEIQSSQDGSGWKAIGQVAALADVSGANSAYSFIDDMPSGNSVFYRLKMLESSGAHEYSPVRQVRFGAMAANNSIRWYPNPSGGQITVKTTAVIDQVRVTDLSGHVVFRQDNVADGAVLNLGASLNTGMYIISFIQDGQMMSDKIMLAK